MEDLKKTNLRASKIFREKYIFAADPNVVVVVIVAVVPVVCNLGCAPLHVTRCLRWTQEIHCG
ncbi:hypothetical protein Phum_PHUM411140 [Pediculus humanus corporis]|uniref:Transmembrane protein n=1 Tax=Pediculus humanus subsp. corporis TaxID=121224 RepID=E0VS42_PEDHC|nr:uncharacterized protein Phum_PHUM411140 [Pediculus humanus corporis]EEB16198.1 hypothetical protein Phum_PHUM411140 [Pediculus humanus corporis]